MSILTPYIHPNANVFLATQNDKEHLSPKLIPGLWYYAEVGWTKFIGPYSNYSEANTHFQVYVLGLRTCKSCGD